VIAWLLALTGPALLALAAAGLADLLRREDLTWSRRALWALAALATPPFTALAYVLTRPTGVERSLLGVPGGERARTRGPREHLVHRAGRMAAHGLFRSVEVLAPPDLPPTGAQLWVASHFGALSDPIVLLYALPRPPRFLAADGLFRYPLLREVLRFAGAIPLRRRQDGGGDANATAFEAAWRALRAGDPVAIFPEGIANDTARLAPLRTGAARIALGAGAPGLVVVPVGIHYQDKAGLRRRVFVDVGRPLDLDAWCVARPGAPDPRAEDRVLVRALTDELEARLRVVAPSFVDPQEQHAMLTAAGIALRGPAGPASYGARADLAAALAERPAEAKAQLVDAVATYRDELDAAGLDDAAVVRHDRRSLRSLAVALALGVLLLPPAAVGAVVHAPLAVVTWASGLLRVAPVTAATIRPTVGVVGAVLTWVAVTWWAVRAELLEGAATVLAFAAVVLPLWGLAALVVGERVLLLASALRRRTRAVTRPRRAATRGADLMTPLRRDRQRLVDLVEAARPAGDGAPHR
jgi:glycerol-3-phosphate O-acyltransferase / dihydroxyacetone phosphate acyltransferase